MALKKTTIVFSINVHENLKFLIKQIENIEANVLVDFVIILNANEYMYIEISNNEILKTKENIILYPKFVNKKHNHGSLTKGICLNMKYAIDNYQFEFFIILSSRNLFYNKLHKDNYNNIPKICEGSYVNEFNRNNEWHWSIFFQSELSKYIIANNLLFCKSYEYHEGLTFDYISAAKIIDFFEKNENIKIDIFDFNWGVEEFALHSISLNLSGYYYNIGNWTNADDFLNLEKLPKDKFVYKTLRN
jgi:hypothetical protein